MRPVATETTREERVRREQERVEPDGFSVRVRRVGASDWLFKDNDSICL